MIVLIIVIGLFLSFGILAFTGAPYVPSKRRVSRKSLRELAFVGPKDHVLDLGSGDGVVLVEAARLGARATGYELHPILVWIANWRLRHFTEAHVYMKDLWSSPFPNDVTLVYVFVNSRDVKRLVRKLHREAKRLDRTLYVLSFGFQLKGLKCVKSNESHFLYEVVPLQSEKA